MRIRGATKILPWMLTCLVPLGLVAVACGEDYGTVDGGVEDSGSDGGAVREDGSPLDADGSSPSPDGASEGGGDGGCPSDMVVIPSIAGTYCIDAHEVSRRQYLAFLEAKGGDTSGQSARCAWNTSFLPDFSLGDGDPNLAVVGVDFCDAEAYCTHSGKHVCGGIKGPWEASTPKAEQEWLVACTRDLGRSWPYGNVYVEGNCAVIKDAGASHRTDAPNACEGGYPGLYDMVGNVWEWVDFTAAVSSAGPAKDEVRFAGGSYGYSEVTCDTLIGLSRDTRTNDIGIRCCK